MRAKFLICLIGAAFGLVVEAKADDVYVDLSVLNDLGPSSGPVMHSEPLFPVIKKSAPKFPVVKKSASKKSAAKKVAVKKPVPEKTVADKNADKQAKRKLKIKQKEIVKAPAAEEKIELPSKPDDIFKVEEIVVEKPASAAPVVEVKTEEIKEAEAPREFVAEVKDNGAQSLVPHEEATVMPNQDVQVPAEAVKSVSVSVAEKETIPVQNDVPVEPLKPAVEEKKVEPLVPVNAAPAPVKANSVSKQIVFASDSYELSDANKEKVSAIVDSFEDPKVNKIAILAYNFDNGEDVFKKKRQSLNRAIEVRSYLLGKGYKNFSIKVINITDDAEKGNIVEIDEIK